MNTQWHRWGVVMCAAAGGLLGGCRSKQVVDYHVQVRNDSSGVVRALVLREAEPRIFPVVDTMVFPRDRGELSIQRRPAGERLTLQVDAPNNPAAPARMPLNPGQTIISVTREGAEGPFRLELIGNR